MALPNKRFTKKERIRLGEICLDTVTIKTLHDDEGWYYRLLFIFCPSMEDLRRFKSQYAARKAAKNDLIFKREWLRSHGKIPSWNNHPTNQQQQKKEGE